MWSRKQQIWLAILPKISSVLSLFGSGWIIMEVVTEKSKRKVPYHRLLCAMSVYDVLESVWNFGSTWPIPEGSPDVIWALGNTATCTAQGFFLTLSVAVPLYNAMLSLYYVLVINYNFTDRRLRQFVEPAMHTFAFVCAFGTALYSALAGLFNNANLWCWMAPLPPDCVDSWVNGTAAEGNPNPCIRGDNIWIYRFCFYFIPLWISILFATVCTYLVYRLMRKREKASLRYRFPERATVWKAMQTFGDDMKNKATALKGAILSKSNEREVPESNDSSSDVKPAPTNIESSEDRPLGAVDKSESSGAYTNGAWALALKTAEEEHASESSEQYSASFNIEPASGFNTVSEESSVTNAPAPPRRSMPSVRISQWKKKREQYAEEMPHTVEVFQQACWFLGVFYCTHIWSTTNRIVQTFSGGGTVYPLLLLHSFFDPFQGFLNYLVYQRPRYLQIRRKTPEVGRLGAIRQTLHFSFYTKKMKRASDSKQSRFSSSVVMHEDKKTSKLSISDRD